MRTLQEELSSIGNVSFTATGRNTTAGSAFENTYVYQTSDVVADPVQCRVEWHRKMLQNGAVRQDQNYWALLHAVTSIVVEPEAQNLNELNAAAGHSNFVITSTAPPVTALLVHKSEGGGNFFAFTDATLASRVANNLKQAVRLCGGHLAN